MSTPYSHNNGRKTHCNEGHPLSGENLIVAGGRRRCRICRKAANQRGRHKRDYSEEWTARRARETHRKCMKCGEVYAIGAGCPGCRRLHEQARRDDLKAAMAPKVRESPAPIPTTPPPPYALSKEELAREIEGFRQRQAAKVEEILRNRKQDDEADLLGSTAWPHPKKIKGGWYWNDFAAKNKDEAA